jgi:AcrR family transcriptional regulator
MRAKKQKSALRQKLITQEALGLLAEHGLHGTSIAELAARVGLVPSGIYRHFKSKDDIIDSVFDFVRERLLANVEQVCQMTTDPLERLSRLLHLHLAMIRENPAVPRLVFSEGIFSEEIERKAKVRQLVEGYLKAVAEIIRTGQQQGAIRSNLDPLTGSVMFLGLIQPMIILSHLTDGEFAVDLHLQRAWAIFLKAIRKRSRTPQQQGEHVDERDAKDYRNQ